ncbi:MAG: tetratricopeptide repeat protein, partial [Armatimonadota bacterium]
MTQLIAAFERAAQGRAQIAFIIGEQAVGKSRLVMEFKHRLLKIRKGVRHGSSQILPGGQGLIGSQNFLWLEGKCRDLGAQTPFFALADLLKRWAAQQNKSEHEHDDGLNAVVSWLYWNGAVTDERAKELLGELKLGLFADYSEVANRPWTSEQLLYQVRTTLNDIFSAAARLVPVVVVLEDIHWADDHTLDFAVELAAAAEHLPLLLLCTLRPEPTGRTAELHDVAARRCPGRCTKIELRELPPQETSDLLKALLKKDGLTQSFKNEIVAKSGGNPFFLQELVRHLIETGRIVRENGRWICSGAGKLDVPERVKSVILSRVSRLKPSRALVLSAGAVLGINFEHRVLQAMLGLENLDLEKILTYLKAKRFLVEESSIPIRKLGFHHALVQQAVYEGIPEDLRAKLHLRAALALEETSREGLNEACQELAYHYMRAGCPDKALPHLIKVGHKARMLCLHGAAVENFTSALRIVADASSSASLLRLKMEALTGLGQTYQGIGDIAAAEQCFRNALAVAEELGVEPRERIRILYWLADLLFWQGRFQEMELVARTGLGLLSDEDSASVEAVIMNSMVGIARGNIGDENEWMRRARRSAELLRQMPYVEEIRRVYAHVIDSFSYSEAKPEEAEEWCALYADLAKSENDLRGVYDAAFRRGQMLLHGGRVAESIRAFQAAADGFEKIGDPKYLCWCLANLAEAHLQIGLLEEAEKYSLQSVQYSQQLIIRRDAGRNLLRLGTIHTVQGKYEEAASDYRRAFAVFNSLSHEYNMALAMTRLALAYMHAGRKERALEYALRALKIGELFPAPFALTLAVLEELGFNISSLFPSLLEQHKETREWHFKQWKLESTAPKPFWCQVLYSTFSRDVPVGFHWYDQTGESEYRINRGLEIRVANGCDLWHINLTAPRLCTKVRGDFAVQTEIGPPPSQRPAIGGLVIWTDRHNFLRLDKGSHGPHEVRFSGTVDGVGKTIGRGRIE